MNRTLLFDSPFLLGFEHTRALVERAAKACLPAARSEPCPRYFCRRFYLMSESGLAWGVSHPLKVG